MRTLRTLKPGQKGTKELLARHGASLLPPRKSESLRFRILGPTPPAHETVLEDSDGLPGVRYRYDEDTREHLKTVELVVRRRLRQPEGEGKLGGQATGVPRRRVALRIGWRERELQARVRPAGGWWDPVRRVWILRHDVAERLDLLHRVVGGGG